MSPDKATELRNRLSRETGAQVKDWGGRFPFALVYPNSYYIGMSNLGIQVIYGLVNGKDEYACERFFYDREDAARDILPLSMESQRPLTDYPAIGFSLNYELDYFNIVPILKASIIPVYAAERDDSHPLVIAGGPCVTSNPMPVAPFFDCLCIGEAEVILPALLDMVKGSEGGSRADLLRNLSTLPGVYVPSVRSTGRVIRQRVPDLDEFPAHSVVLSEDTELGDLFMIEAERGCNWGCRFCMVGSAFSPMRYRSRDSIVRQAKEGLAFRKRIGLVGPAVHDHPEFGEILRDLKEIGTEISVSSLRVKPLSSEALQLLVGSGARSIALAPEAGSERLRWFIRKNITESDILAAVKTVASAGVSSIKLYFMIGLPSETDEDISEIINLSLKCKAILDKVNPGCRLLLTVSAFVPKAGTPFQWLPAERLAVLNSRLKKLKKELRTYGIDVKSESPAWSHVQTILSRGGTELAAALAGMNVFSLANWKRALRETGVDADKYLFAQWETERPLPWSVIDPEGKEKQLAHELGKALEKTGHD